MLLDLRSYSALSKPVVTVMRATVHCDHFLVPWTAFKMGSLLRQQMMLIRPRFFEPGGGGIFYSLKEAQVVIEQWRVEYNTRRPHSALG